MPYSQHYLDSVENTDKVKCFTSLQAQDQWSDRCKARSGQGLSRSGSRRLSKRCLCVCVCPGTTTFTDQHVRARMHLRMASLTFKARSGLRAIARSLAQLLALSGLPIVAVSGLQNVRLLPRRALSGPTSPCLLWEFVSRESETPKAWTSVLG